MRSTVANERGIALVITLLVVALLTITVVEFTYSVEVDSHMAHNALDGVQAGLLARSGINFGEAVLLKNFETQQQSAGAGLAPGTRFAFPDSWCVDNDGQPNFAGDYPSCDFEPDSKLRVPDNMRLVVRIFDEGGKIDFNQVRPQQKNDCTVLENIDTTSTNPTNQAGLLGRLAALGRVLDLAGAGPQVMDLYLEYSGQCLCGAPFENRESSNSCGAATHPWQHPDRSINRTSGLAIPAAVRIRIARRCGSVAQPPP